MRYYVNLPLAWVHRDDGWLGFYAGRGLNPELGFDELSLGLPAAWHREKALRLQDSGLAASAHLPFFGPLLGGGPLEARQAGADILKKAADVAAIYGAAHLIGHPSFFAHGDAGGKAPAPGDIGQRPSERWLQNSVAGWQEVLAVSDAPLYLENTHDSGPEAVLALLGELARGDCHARIGMCFDIGHWFSFAQGCDRNNLHEWLDKIAPRLKHLHLHDNAGHGDEHLGLGQGSIPLDDFFRELTKRGLAPSFTLEPHNLDALEHSLAWLAAHGAEYPLLRGGAHSLF